jgi:hypothetical protein
MEYGNWTADVEVGGLEPITGAASLLVYPEEGEPDTHVGFVRHGDPDVGRSRVPVKLVGGAGNLRTVLPPRCHVNGSTTVPAGLVARGIADAAGETLAAGVEDALDAHPLPRWDRVEGTALEALDVLADALGLVWRVLVDGTIWIGADTWTEVDAARVYELSREPDDGLLVVATDGAPMRPGMTALDAQIVEVRYTVSAVELGATLRAVTPADPPRVVTPSRLYRAAHPATVKAQRADGSLDVRPDDARLPDMLAVPVVCGVPGAKLTIAAEERVVVAFEAGSPQGARVVGFEQDRTATKAVARKTDPVSLGYLAGIANPATGVVTFTLSPTVLPDSVQLVGTITGGSAEVWIR